MLVEDDPSMLAVLRTLLEIAGYAPVYLPDRAPVDELVATVRGEKPDVILLDVNLRHLNGYDVVRAIRADEQARGAYVVMSSGMDVAIECMAAGADDFLMKPYMPDELFAKLEGSRKQA
jgi:DNA-binding response OmpR family regulator